MPRLTVLTLNAAIQDVRLLGRSVYCPVPFTRERLAALAAELRAVDADVVCLQEMFHPDLQRRLHRNLGRVYPFASGFSRTRPGFRLQSEFLVLSRHPLSAGRLRRFRSAALEELLFTSKGWHDMAVSIPGLGPVDLMNFHMTAGGLRAHPQSSAMERVRDRQVAQILERAARGPHFILAGDLNAGPHTSCRNYRRVLDAGFVDAFEEARGEGMSWDPGNPLVAGGPESHLPPQRIDHIFVSQALAGRLRPTAARVVLSAARVGTRAGAVPVSDHYGVLVEFDYAA